MAKDDDLLAEFRKLGPDLVKVANGMEAITRLVGTLLEEDTRTQTET